MGIIILSNQEKLYLIKMAEKDMKKEQEVHEDIHKIRMTLRGREVKPLEHACSEIVARAKQQGFKVAGPKRIPTKILTVTTRRSPCGNGTNTYDHFEMRIHKRVIDVWSQALLSKKLPTSESTLVSMLCSLSTLLIISTDDLIYFSTPIKTRVF